MIVIGLSGAQGGGKTSMLNELKRLNYRVDDFKVSRAVQASLGWASLDRVMDAPETMQAFQNEVLQQKFKNDFELARQGDGVIFVERTFADILAYSNLWTFKFAERGQLTKDEAVLFSAKYTASCLAAHEQCYSGTMLLPLMEHVKFEVDPHRAKEEDAEYVFNEVQRFLTTLVQAPLLHITAKSIAVRAMQAARFSATF